MLWTPHPGSPNTWYTRSPYLAAPFWDWTNPADNDTRLSLQHFTWNYRTSFATDPIPGTPVSSIRIPAGETPFPFQVAGVQRAMMRNRILIADEPGLGKTVQSLVVANMTRPDRIVIGCPTALVQNWACECERWLVDPRSITILDGARRAVTDRGVLIVPYSRAHSFVDHINAGPQVDLMILDESHFLKDPSARRTSPWFGKTGLAYRARRVIAASGTPVPNNPLELHGAMQALAPDSIGAVSRERFKELYCSTFKGKMKIETRHGGEISKEFEKNTGVHEEVLNAELRASGLMIRRRKDDVLKQLPPKNVYLLHLTPTAQIDQLVREESSLYEALEARILTSQELMQLRGHISRVRAQLGALKAPKIAEYVQSIFENGEDRVVLMMLHREAMTIVAKHFESTRIRVRMVTGAENPTQRKADVDAFQKPGGAELLIGQIAAAGVGLTMTAARFCVLGEIAWTPAANDQAIDRVHRITQTRQVDAPVITFPHAVEERVLKANAKKAISARAILDTNLGALVA